jgi:predicted secreted protein with PEFG-CTERM motif
MTDSVTFSATVIPEFPAIAVLPLAIGIAAAIVISFRLRAGRVM